MVHATLLDERRKGFYEELKKETEEKSCHVYDFYAFTLPQNVIKWLNINVRPSLSAFATIMLEVLKDFWLFYIYLKF